MVEESKKPDQKEVEITKVSPAPKLSKKEREAMKVAYDKKFGHKEPSKKRKDEIDLKITTWSQEQRETRTKKRVRAPDLVINPILKRPLSPPLRHLPLSRFDMVLKVYPGGLTEQDQKLLDMRWMAPGEAACRLGAMNWADEKKRMKE